MSYASNDSTGPAPRFITDDTFMEEFLGYIERGVPPYRAAEICGVHRQTYYVWAAKGGHPSTSGNLDAAFEPYIGFIELVLAAEAKAYIDVVTAVHEKAKTDGNVGVRYIKTRYPEDFGDQEGPTVVVEQGGGSTQISLDDFLAIHRKVKRETSDESE